MSSYLLSKSKVAAIIVNPGCNNKCLFCAPWGIKKKSKEEMGGQELNIYKNLKGYEQKGYKKIEISGNDPLEYHLIIPLIKYIKKEGFDSVMISTNGRKLSDKNFLEKFIDSGIDCVRIPLYGHNAKVHDAVTFTKGSFDETIRGIKLLKKMAPKIEIFITSLIVEQNKKELIDVFKFTKSLKADYFRFSIPCIAWGTGEGYYVPIKELPRYVSGLINYSLNNNERIEFVDVPYCVFGEDYDFIRFSNAPELGEHQQPPTKYKGSVKNIPKYRTKVKVEMCKKCVVYDKCGGFYLNDITNYGLGGLKPLMQRC